MVLCRTSECERRLWHILLFIESTKKDSAVLSHDLNYYKIITKWQKLRRLNIHNPKKVYFGPYIYNNLNIITEIHNPRKFLKVFFLIWKAFKHVKRKPDRNNTTETNQQRKNQHNAASNGPKRALSIFNYKEFLSSKPKGTNHTPGSQKTVTV